MYTISAVHNPDRQNYLNLAGRWFDIQAEEIFDGLGWEEHEPVKIWYNPTATCFSRTMLKRPGLEMYVVTNLYYKEVPGLMMRLNSAYLAVSALVMI